MADQDDRPTNARDDARNVFGIVLQRKLLQAILALTAGMAAQAERVSGPALLCEPWQIVILPAPGTVEGSVHEQEVRAIGGNFRQAGEELYLHGSPYRKGGSSKLRSLRLWSLAPLSAARRSSVSMPMRICSPMARS